MFALSIFSPRKLNTLKHFLVIMSVHLCDTENGLCSKDSLPCSASKKKIKITKYFFSTAPSVVSYLPTSSHRKLRRIYPKLDSHKTLKLRTYSKIKKRCDSPFSMMMTKSSITRTSNTAIFLPTLWYYCSFFLQFAICLAFQWWFITYFQVQIMSFIFFMQKEIVTVSV